MTTWTPKTSFRQSRVSVAVCGMACYILPIPERIEVTKQLPCPAEREKVKRRISINISRGN